MFLLLLACASPSGGGPPAWAIDYASLSQAEDGSWSGHHVWVLYEQGWSKSPGSEWHLCSVLQRLDGTPIEESQGCTDCLAQVQVQVSEIESDCDEGWVGESFLAPMRMGVGKLPADLAEQAPHPDSMGWFLASGDMPMSPQGYVTATALEQGRDAPTGWNVDQGYTLWPAFAWRL